MTRADGARGALALAILAAGCAHREVEPARVDEDWVRPRIDEAAHAALRCLRGEPDRVIEIEVSTEGQARAFQLLHVLLHELGHHHDHMTTRSRRSAARGEWFAENYASQYEAQVWNDYLRRFGLD